MNWDKMTAIVQTCIYTAGIVAMIIVVTLMYQSNTRMQKEHDAIMKRFEDTCKEWCRP